MATVRQIEANRRNAQQSTGPRTDTGKAAVRNNALKHGLAAALPHECAAELAEFRASLIDSWQPANTHEQLAVEVIAESYLRMQRASRFEAEFFATEIGNLKADLDLAAEPDASTDDAHAAAILTAERHEHAVKMIERYSQRATSKYFKAVEQLRKMQAERRHLEATDQKQQAHNARLASFCELLQEPEHATAAAASPASVNTQSASFGETLLIPIPSPMASFGVAAPQGTSAAAPLNEVG